MQRFIVPGSCPNIQDIPLQTFPPLDVEGPVVGTGPITLRVTGRLDPERQRVAFINGALVPTVVPFKILDVPQGRSPWTESVLATRERANQAVTHITADFPFAANVMHGLTLAAVVWDRPSFITAEDVTNATVYGPAVIEVE